MVGMGNRSKAKLRLLLRLRARRWDRGGCFSRSRGKGGVELGRVGRSGMGLEGRVVRVVLEVEGEVVGMLRAPLSYLQSPSSQALPSQLC